MKKISFFAFLLVLSIASYGQGLDVGLRGGLSSTQIDFDSDQFVPDGAQTGFHVGLFARLNLASIYVQPELLFTKTNGEFLLESDDVAGEVLNAEFNRLDIPVMIGVKLMNILRIQAGPIASLNMNSEITNATGTVRDADFNAATLGYQAGVGVDIKSIYIDAKYEGGLGAVTESIGGFNTDNRLNQFVVSVGIRLF